MKQHWTKKLKEENKKLRNDIRKIINGDLETILIYKVTFKNEEEFEKMIWIGSTTK